MGAAPLAPGHLLAARFRGRPNRFVVRAVLGDGRPVRAHLADPGRLSELLVPAAELRLRRYPANASRKTRYGVALVRAPGRPAVWVGVETGRANRLAARLLADGALGLRAARGALRREPRCGTGRLDFRVDDPAGGRLWIEVKSVTLVERGIGRFPDAPTARGRRHLGELVERVRCGDRALVLFVVQRCDARAVTAHPRVDPQFAARLAAARRAGVELRAAAFRMVPSGAATYLGRLPVRTATRRRRTAGGREPA